LSAQKLPAYEVQKERKLSVSAGAFTVEGRARDVLQDRSEVKPKEEWFHVRRLWIKRDNQWLLYAQIITPEDEAKEEKEKELK
jgi:hypothetical protein